MKTNKPLFIFLAITFVVDWSIAGIMYIGNIKMQTVLGMILGVSYMMVPMLAAIFVKKVIMKEEIKQSLGISFKINKWFFVAWLLPPILAFVALLISLLMPNVSYSPEMQGMFERFRDTLSPEQLEDMRKQIEILPVHPIFLTVLQGLIAGFTINAVAGFGEELGWRGFLFREYSGKSFWDASLTIGFIWGLWHAPLILQGHNYPQHPYIGAIMFIFWCIALSPIFNYIRIKARSVIAVSIMHGTINATYGISILVLMGGDDLTVGLTGLPGFITLGIALLGIIILDRFILKDNITSKTIEESLYIDNNKLQSVEEQK